MLEKERMYLVCSNCTNRSINLDKGIQCRVTNSTPNFEGNCSSFKRLEFDNDPVDLKVRQRRRLSDGVREFLSF